MTDSDEVVELCDDGSPPILLEQPDGTMLEQCQEAAAGFPVGIIFFVFLAVLGGLAFTVWKVGTARRMAREAGMDVGDATRMTLLSDDGFEATYLGATLRQQPDEPEPGPAQQDPPAERLRRLDDLRAQELITEEEFAARRQAIIDEL